MDAALSLTKPGIGGVVLGARDDEWWTVTRGASPIVGTAIHNGHQVRGTLRHLMAIAEPDRLREEDPFTEFLIRDLSTRFVCHRSRFEVDLNRSREQAVYLEPEQAWGQRVWHNPVQPDIVAESLRIHDAYYSVLEQVLRGVEKDYGAFVVLDVHSYNHRRNGPAASPAADEVAPDVNIGTSSMDTDRWKHVVVPFMESLRNFDFMGRQLDVRENVAFQGRGEQTRFIHQAFPKTGCAIAVEFKKIFMDEWTGAPDVHALLALRSAIQSAVPLLEQCLRAGK